ncbi:MAG: HD domain-containing protein [Thermodesulfobacteriota bacterium]
MPKTKFVSDLAKNEKVEKVTFAVSSIATARKKDGSDFLRLVLADRTGTINAVAWDNVDKIGAAARSGVFVDATGVVDEYQSSRQMKIEDLAAVDQAQIDPADFLPSLDRETINAKFSRLRQITNDMASGEIKTLLGHFWNDRKFVEERFKRAPAAKHMHHAYLGGLLEHTLSVVELALAVCRHYGDRLNRDLLVAGAMLHDIGKTREFVYDWTIDYSDEGRMLNHIVCGIMMLEDKLKEFEFVTTETALQLKHLIASHHGSREFGSPEPPKTLEALILNHIDEIDAKLAGIGNFISEQEPGQVWTSFHRPMERFFYIGRKKEG